jgi:16S rRNA (uracil1498-N3)-methyltransferase
LSIFYQPRLGSAPYLDEDESRHAVKVLRLGAGAVVQVVDGAGTWHEAVITRPDARRCELEIRRSWTEPPRPYRVHLAIAPTKNLDRIEWLTEKCVEIGVDEISFLETRYSERRHLKLDRLERIAVGAMKQSLKARLPVLNELRPFAEWLAETSVAGTQRFVAHLEVGERYLLQTAAQPTGSYCVLIGPEGDFSPDEIAAARQAGFQPVSLGESRLRTETAGLVAVHTLHLINQVPT